MSDDQLDDLKQFIDSRLSQIEANFGEKLDGVESRLDTKIEDLRQEMLEGFAGVGESVEELNDRFDKHMAKAEKRLAKLEQQAA